MRFSWLSPLLLIALAGCVQQQTETNAYGQTVSVDVWPWGTWFIIVACIAVAGWVIGSTIHVIDAYESAVILRLGKFQRVAEPGLVITVPFVDNIFDRVDQRVQTTTIKTESVLTKDTVPIGVDAVIFWRVVDVKAAALNVTAYEDSIDLAGQTALRDTIGSNELSAVLSSRDALDAAIQTSIAAKAASWGIEVQSVEIRDVTIPVSLQDAMSRQAQAQRESQAREIFGESEKTIALQYVDAAKIYAGSPEALHLRGMGMLYESMKEKGALVIVPSSAVETMGLGSVAGLAATRVPG